MSTGHAVSPERIEAWADEARLVEAQARGAGLKTSADHIIRSVAARAFEAGRADALEEAAKVCEVVWKRRDTPYYRTEDERMALYDAEDAIRALASAPRE